MGPPFAGQKTVTPLGILAALSINLTMSHEVEYESDDADESGSHRGRFSITPGTQPGAFRIVKTHRHEDYAEFSQENTKPGGREEERQHLVHLDDKR